MTGLLLLYICLATSGLGFTNAVFCPQDCFCREHWMWSRNVFVVTRNFRNMSKVPDLSPLSSITLPIFIKLSYSNLTRVTKEDFPPELRINFISLGGNRRLVIQDDAFSNVRDSLVYLDLETTQTFFNTTLRFLKGLSKLENLTLSYNNKYNYQTVSSDVKVSLFGGLGLTSLKKVKMYNCGMRTMSEAVFLGVETVEELDLGANSLNAVPDAIFALPKVKTLDFSSSQIEIIKSRTFIKNKKLRTLIMMYSKVKLIDADAFEGLETSLHTLDMRDSHLDEVPSSALKPLKALKILKLDGNRIKAFSADSFSGSYCLEQLSLSNMHFDFSDDMFEGQENCIKDLSLRNMHLMSIPRQPLTTLHKLHNLFLDDNQIAELKPNSLAGIKTSLFVFTGNPLRKIHKGAFNGTSRPLFLSIDHTRVKSLKFVLDYPKGTFESLDATAIPIVCDCTTARVVKIMKKGSLSGTCGNTLTGAGIGFQTDTAHRYLSRKCPHVMTSSGTTLNHGHVATVVAFYLFFLLNFGTTSTTQR